MTFSFMTSFYCFGVLGGGAIFLPFKNLYAKSPICIFFQHIYGLTFHLEIFGSIWNYCGILFYSSSISLHIF